MLNHYWQLIQKNNLFGLRDDTRIGGDSDGEAGVGGRRAAASVGDASR
ncbi:glutathione biosynthesis bifunctional protein, partial [Lacticaseibacillus paracasei subsp. paracasei CNCM I-4648]